MRPASVSQQPAFAGRTRSRYRPFILGAHPEPSMSLRPLDGYVVGVTADRRWRELAELLQRRGASVVHGPTIQTEYLGSDLELERATLTLVEDPPDYLVVTTGIGVRAWFEAAASWGLAERLLGALTGARTVARGPKAAAALVAGGIPITAQCGDEQMESALRLLLSWPLAGTRIAVQEYGEANRPFVDALRGAGATVVTVPVYRWHLPDDRGPATRLVEMACEGRVDALTFTSAPALRNLFAVAAGAGADGALRDALNGGVAAVCVGPVCAGAARRHGIDSPVSPAVGRLGLLVRELIEHVAAHVRVFNAAGSRLVMQGSVIEVDGSCRKLAGKQRVLLHTLAARPGVLVSRADLLTRVWGAEGADPHALEVTVGRLRQALGSCASALRVVPARGYRLDVEELGSLPLTPTDVR